MVAVQMQDDLRRVLDDDGKVLPGAKVPQVSDETLHKIFDTMMLVRIMDDRMMRLQRQGRLGFYMKSIGEEASHFAVVPLRTSDWVFPSYREQGAWFWRGYSVTDFINQMFGNEKDPVKGRQMPVHHSANWLNLVSISSPVGTQIPQAVGTAQAAKISGKDDVAMVFFGEGTSSTGEFHVGMNFAGVWKSPCVFVCRNNGWAISVPREKQTAAKTFASKAVGYGMPGVRVDGNDILAMLQVVERGGRSGPRRRGPDPDRGADLPGPGPLQLRRPVGLPRPQRARRSGRRRTRWPGCAATSRAAACGARRSRPRSARSTTRRSPMRCAEVDRLGPPPIESMFDDVYEHMPWNLAEQKAWLLAQPRTKSPHQHH